MPKYEVALRCKESDIEAFYSEALHMSIDRELYPQNITNMFQRDEWFFVRVYLLEEDMMFLKLKYKPVSMTRYEIYE